MYTNQVIVQARNENPLKVGIGHNLRPPHLLCLSAFTVSIGGQNKHFAYQNEFGKKEDIMVDGQRVFNMDNAIDKHNVTVLRVFKKMYPELAEDLIIIDPNRDADEAFALEVRRNELITTLFAHADDGDWLANVYRSVIGIASGLTSKVMVTTLVQKAKDDVLAFGKKEWVFDSPEFDTRSLLLQGVERGIVLRETTPNGDFFRKQDGTVFADNLDTAVFQLKADKELRLYLQGAVSQPLNVAAASTTLDPDVDPELAKLINEVSTPVDRMSVQADGSMDSDGQEARIKAELKELVGKLVAVDLIQKNHVGKFTVDGASGIDFDTEDELLGWLRGNPELVKDLKQLAEIE